MRVLGKSFAQVQDETNKPRDGGFCNSSAWEPLYRSSRARQGKFYGFAPFKTIDKDQKKIVRLELISFPGLLQQAKSH